MVSPTYIDVLKAHIAVLAHQRKHRDIIIAFHESSSAMAAQEVAYAKARQAVEAATSQVYNEETMELEAKPNLDPAPVQP